MTKVRLVRLSLVVLFFLSQLAFASIDLKDKYTGMSFSPSGNSIALPKNSAYATEILVINNTPYTFKVEVPYTSVGDWLPSNRVYRITSNTVFPTTNVRLWHPDYGYINNYVSNYSIISFALQYNRVNVITVEYH